MYNIYSYCNNELYYTRIHMCTYIVRAMHSLPILILRFFSHGWIVIKLLSLLTRLYTFLRREIKRSIVLRSPQEEETGGVVDEILTFRERCKALFGRAHLKAHHHHPGGKGGASAEAEASLSGRRIYYEANSDVARFIKCTISRSRRRRRTKRRTSNY